MHYLSFSVLVACLLLLFCGCGEKSWDGSTVPDTGVLVKWSEQKMESDKKIIFIHGLNMGAENYQGSIVQKVEKDFDLKLININSLGSECFGKKTTELVECWFYIYNTQQDIGKIATDLIELIRKNRNFNDAQIALVGYSQGGVVAWLIDQRYNLINGGVILGAPILSTPLAHKEILGKSLNDVYPIAGESIKNGLASLADRVEHLKSYPETGLAKSNLLFMVGSIGIPSKNALSRNWALIETVLNEGDYLVGNASSKRQLLEVGSLLIDSADWGECKEGSCFSDGAVPVCSAVPNTEANMMEWKDYDHEELLSGKGDFDLDRTTLQHLGKVLDLFPKFTEADLPLLPELEIHFSNRGSVWDWIKFAYVINGQLFVTDEDWDRKELVYSGKNCYPRFGLDNSLVWTNLSGNNFDICIWQEDGVAQTKSTASRYASFSPSNEELVYQHGKDLIIHNLASDKFHVLVQDVGLVASPVLVQNKSAYKIYFANQEADKTINLYSINSKVDNKYLADAQIVATNCSFPFLATGYFNGVVVISNISKSHQVVKVISGGKLFSNISIDITGLNNVYEISGTTKKIKLKLPEEFRFDSVVFDAKYGHLYLVGLSNSVYGLWLLDIKRILVSNNPNWDEVFYSVLSGVEYIDIRLTD